MEKFNEKWMFWGLFLVVIVALGGCATKPEYEKALNIVEPAEVGRQMNQSGVVVVDAREESAYKKGHLKGAIHISAGTLSVSDPVKGLIASAKTVESVLSQKGISPEDTIFVYDDKGGVFSGRIWWVLKAYGHKDIRVINQGARGLEKEGLSMSAAIPKREKTNYKFEKNVPDMYADLSVMQEVVAGEKPGKIIDVRSRSEFDEGAIPGAILYPHTANLYTDGSFHSKRTVELNYRDLGLKKDDPVFLYCKTSFRATQTALLLKEAGYKNVFVYDGAWMEWEKQNMPSEKEEAPVMPTEQDAS